MPVSGLDKPCGTCGRRSGDHTLDEWAVCLGQTTLDLPYEDAAGEVAAVMRGQFGLDDDVIVADHVVIRALTLRGSFGDATGFKLPALEHTFQIGVVGQAPVSVARVLFMGNPEAVRKYGVLARDSANGAARAAER